MSTFLDLLPRRIDTAAANMADDNLLLENLRPGTLRLRFYGWSAPAFSFGVFQSLAWVKSQLPSDTGNATLVRRPTGGGLVDHRSDWTYTLAMPAGHPLADGPATETYRSVHATLAETLGRMRVPAGLVPCPKTCGVNSAPAAPPTVCFQRPETHDVLELSRGRKIAGASLRRTRNGLLLQGSLLADELKSADRALFETLFAQSLAELAGAELAEASWPFPDDDPRRQAGMAIFASESWTARR